MASYIIFDAAIPLGIHVYHVYLANFRKFASQQVMYKFDLLTLTSHWFYHH